MKNTNKLIAWAISIALLTSSFWVANADFWDRWFKSFKWWKHKIELSEAEKTSLENMTKEEKREFFKSKKEEIKQKRLERENIIDKLLAWETLNSEEEALRAEIIKERAERKQKRLEKEAKKEEIKEILEKKKAWEDLSDEEQTKLDEFKEEFGKKKRGWKKKNKRFES